MGKFNNKIEAEFNPPKQWILSRTLSYQNDDIDDKALETIGVNCSGHRITCKKGFKTDLASTPKILWNLIAPWDIARAAIIHDLLYLRIRQYRFKTSKTLANENIVMNNYNTAKKAADKVFLMAMLDASPSVPKWKIYASYYAVVLCGRWSIIPRDGD
jgi:hypothetical protein